MSRGMCEFCRGMCKFSAAVQFMEVEGSDDESVESNDPVQFMEVEGSDDESVESDDPVQFMEVEGADHESVESDDPDVQQRAAQAFNVVCEELGDLIMARLPVRDLLRTRSVCKYLRACSLQLNSKYFRRRQLEAGVTDWYFPTFCVGGAKSVTGGQEMGAWMGLHQPSSGVLSLPPFSFLPFSLESMVMVAASGGLVCFQKLPPDAIFDPAAYVCSHGAIVPPPKPYRTYDFIICNPLTKKWRRLPSITPIAGNLSLLKLLVVDPKNYSQEYDFLLLGRDFSWKYSSSQHTWESGNHRHSVWNSSQSQPTATTTTAAGHGVFMNGSGGSTIFKGRLYCLSTSSTPNGPRPQLHAIHQLDLQTLTWLDDLVWWRHLGATAPIKNIPNPDVGEQPPTRPLEPNSLLNPQLVVCAGTLFAVLPVLELNPHRSDCLNNPFTSKKAREYIPRTRLEIISERENLYREGLRFRIFNLLEVPETPDSHESMCTAAEFNQRDYYAEMPAYMDLPSGPLARQRTAPSQLWFSCTAKDDKIWMATAKQLISYDVHTNCWESKPLLDLRLTYKEYFLPHASLHYAYPMELNFTAIP
ncbi:unnamed protein product [Sphagnum jensenii]|uniref:F-box domain-containing protein n=1 Tax=Sphagnum jensenii TaxID=128206 RepID=A0ABP1AH84_9BRYO